ncbi:MAG TPA: LacI family DNA-binding transcriptional regulator, partial [Solirubrobacteraceae bacterium]
MAGKTTIRDLARAGGVSVGTVSRALNGYTDVNAQTREKILRLAAEMDYTPAAAARALVTQRSHVVGIFLETGEG